MRSTYSIPSMDCPAEESLIRNRLTDTALETADVALMQDDLRGVHTFIEISRRTAAVLTQNIAVAIGIKAVFFVLALFGVATMWMAVVADMGTSRLVVANGMRLLRANAEIEPRS